MRIGALVTNSDLAAAPIVRQRYPVLAQAILAGASGQFATGRALAATSCSGRVASTFMTARCLAINGLPEADARRSKDSTVSTPCWA